jgi:hypothetical protein
MPIQSCCERLRRQRLSTTPCEGCAERGRGWVPQGAHKGHVTAMAGLEGDTAVGGGAPLLLTGGHDGVLRVWDSRQSNCVKEQPLHVGSRGAGASSPHARITPVVLSLYGPFSRPRSGTDPSSPGKVAGPLRARPHGAHLTHDWWCSYLGVFGCIAMHRYGATAARHTQASRRPLQPRRERFDGGRRGRRHAGALVAIQACAAASAVVTAGADARLQVLDPRASWAPRCTHSEHSDFICTAPFRPCPTEG